MWRLFIHFIFFNNLLHMKCLFIYISGNDIRVSLRIFVWYMKRAIPVNYLVDLWLNFIYFSLPLSSRCIIITFFNNYCCFYSFLFVTLWLHCCLGVIFFLRMHYFKFSFICLHFRLNVVERNVRTESVRSQIHKLKCLI